MESSGARLKKIRLEKGLTLEEVCRRTKIHLNILKAIEDDSLIGLSPIYIKGFLKIYCKFLGVDPKDFISDHRANEEKQKPSPRQQQLQPAGFSFRSAGGKILSFLPRVRIKTLFYIVAAIAAIFIIFKAGKFITAKVSEARKAKSAQRQELKVAKTAGKTTQKEKKIPLSGNIRLGIRAKSNCYITVKSDGRVVFQGVLRKGLSEVWQSKEKIEFSLNNATAVELEINGNPIESLGRKGQAVKAVITKEGGLKVLR
ncbi:MAG: DUF4115 domain-containing protein [Candidatus Omnitrophica bacterium]|nr:DUF4115 domain-containing protein [Candidatus Omnitrophota bacterium]